MEYKTVVRSSIMYVEKASERLDEKVNELLLDGWSLLGDVSISVSPHEHNIKTIYTIAQAMTKDS